MRPLESMLMLDSGYGLAIGDEQSKGPLFSSEVEADREGQAVADAQQTEVTVFRFEASRGDGVFTDVEKLRVLRPTSP